MWYSTNKKDQWPPVVGVGGEIIDKGVTVWGGWWNCSVENYSGGHMTLYMC